MFVDVAQISVAAGKGGAGCVSTRREKYVPRGGPDGGNGGAGGSVWIVAGSENTTLLDFRYRRRYRAQNGQPGQGRRRSGAAGEDLTIPVPCGTAVFDAGTDELLGDLVDPGDRVCAAAGGRGGKGNHEFRTPRNQTPMFAQPGLPGEEREIRLELKLIADIGLIGAPNAGKSTLLGVLTAARPKVAAYPFTTLVPNLGIVDLGDFCSCTLADIPGLIEGASEGKGLGLEFLRHVERTRALLYLVDLADGDPVPALAAIRQELRQYGRRLPELGFGVALTKLDIVDDGVAAEAVAAATAWASSRGGQGVLAISAVSHRGLSELRYLLRSLFQATASPADED